MKQKKEDLRQTNPKGNYFGTKQQSFLNNINLKINIFSLLSCKYFRSEKYEYELLHCLPLMTHLVRGNK